MFNVKAMVVLVVTAILLYGGVVKPAAAATPSNAKVLSFPEKLPTDCRDGNAKLYDECGSQMLIAEQAFKAAAETGKTPLIIFGPEWCIWCHVFDKHVKGESEVFSYEWEYRDEVQKWKMYEQENKHAQREAKTLSEYVAANFVLVHIESDFAPDGAEVIESIGYDRSKIYFFPYILVVDKEGQYAAHMRDYDYIEGLEIREDSGKEYRGLNRVVLLEQLKKLRAAAM